MNEPFESTVTRALTDSVRTLEMPDRWEQIPPAARQIRRRRRIWAGGTAGTLAAAAALTVAFLAPPGGPTRVKTLSTTVPPSPSVTTPASSLPSPVVTTPTPRLPVYPATGYVPMFPFVSVGAAESWESAYQSSGTQPWHLSAAETALAFANWLGYTNVNRSVSTSVQGSDARASVGYSITGSPGSAQVAAVVHLVRYGRGADAPWEVVGTDDTTLSLTRPGYDASVGRSFAAGGTITGVDESLTVKVLGPASSAPLVSTCCHAAGGTNSAWSVPVAVAAPAGEVLVVAVSTGGHVAPVERFAVTGVRER